MCDSRCSEPRLFREDFGGVDFRKCIGFVRSYCGNHSMWRWSVSKGVTLIDYHQYHHASLVNITHLISCCWLLLRWENIRSFLLDFELRNRDVLRLNLLLFFVLDRLLTFF